MCLPLPVIKQRRDHTCHRLLDREVASMTACNCAIVQAARLCSRQNRCRPVIAQTCDTQEAGPSVLSCRQQITCNQQSVLSWHF